MNFFAFDINLFAFAFIFLLKFRFVGSHFLLRQTMRGLRMRDRIRAHGATLKNLRLDLIFNLQLSNQNANLSANSSSG